MLPFGSIKSPRIPMTIEGHQFTVLLDTGAEVSVLPKRMMDSLIGDGSRHVKLGETKSVKPFANEEVQLQGPWCLSVSVCGVPLVHPFYTFEDITGIPAVVGIDLITIARLVIDVTNKCVYSHRYAYLEPTSMDNPGCPALVAEHVAGLVPAGASVACSDHYISVKSVQTDCSLLAQDFGGPSYSGVGAPSTCSTNARERSLLPAPCSHSSLAPTPPLLSPATNSCEPTAYVPDDDLTLAYPHATTLASCSELPLADTDIPYTYGNDHDHTYVKTAPTTELPEHVNLLFLKTTEENKLSSEVTKGLKTLLQDHHMTFAKDSSDLGFCDILQHDIDTGDSAPIKQSPRRPPLAATAAEDEILNEMLSTGVIEPSNSSWASPVCLVKKKDGTYRFCVDYRRVNAVSKKDAFPVPDIQDALDHLRGAKYFATFDLLSGYWQLGLTERAQERSAFCTRRGLFHFTRMPFGLAGAPSSFCRLMSIVLRDLLWEICLCYLDDIVIFARSPEELLHRLRKVLDRLRSVGLKVKPSKCALFQEQVQFLGHQVSQNGIEPLPEKVEAIKNWPRPHCLRDVRAFYGLASYYRRFVKGFATIAEPLTKLTRKNVSFEWTNEAQEAFEKLKLALQEATTLAFPYPDIPCVLDTDASDVAIGAVLSQVIEGVERPIAFYSTRHVQHSKKLLSYTP